MTDEGNAELLHTGILSHNVFDFNNTHTVYCCKRHVPVVICRGR